MVYNYMKGLKTMLQQCVMNSFQEDIMLFRMEPITPNVDNPE